MTIATRRKEGLSVRTEGKQKAGINETQRRIVWLNNCRLLLVFVCSLNDYTWMSW
jgi:hypothetical protein